MAICEFDEMYCMCEGSKVVRVWFVAPSMQRMSGLSLA